MSKPVFRTPFALLLAAATLAFACGGGEEEAAAPEGTADTEQAAPAGPTGAVSGTVNYAADADPDTPIKMDADPVCAGLHQEPVTTQKIITDGQGHLANVFVWVKETPPGSYQPPAEQAVIDQKGCQYQPHVQGVMVGQELLIRNSDPTLHNIHALPAKNQEFNQGQPFEGMEMTKTFDEVELPPFHFKCDVHPWMSSYLGVVPHPFFATSDDSGSFQIANLPPGTYTLEAWHEELGSQTQQITVEPDQTVEVTFDYGGGQPAAETPAG